MAWLLMKLKNFQKQLSVLLLIQSYGFCHVSHSLKPINFLDPLQVGLVRYKLMKIIEIFLLILDWIPGTPIPADIYLIYILQLGFYIHMIYATTYIETVRKDYFVQMLHHVLTLALLGYSFVLR